MTKIITSENRIIFDGHASTREECETISLMCEELRNSKAFKTIKYESGYAEFEKIVGTNDLKFIPTYSLGTIYLLIDSNNIEIGYDALDEPLGSDPPNITIEKQKIISTSESFWGISNFDYVDVSDDHKQLIIKDGYEIELVEYPDIIGNGGTAYYVGDSFHEIAANSKATYITLKKSETVSRKSIDLTALSGWSSLSSGSHSITIVAKADGYRDSEPSAAVSVEKASEVTLISFTISGTSYQAEEGMTWAEWVESEYNTSNYVCDNGAITDSYNFVSTPSGHVSSTDTIISDYAYAGSGAGGGAN